jgi:Rrf2 family protein
MFAMGCKFVFAVGFKSFEAFHRVKEERYIIASALLRKTHIFAVLRNSGIMKMNTKVRYGLRTMIEISLPENEGGILQKDIASKQGISEKYLDTIIAGLKVAGLIKNAAGKKSGYILSKSSDRISVYDIYRAFEPEPGLAPCLGNHELCPRTNHCAAMEYWNELTFHLSSHLKNKNLKDLATAEQEFQSQKQNTVNKIITAQIHT